jgi:hypothetical protein
LLTEVESKNTAFIRAWEREEGMGMGYLTCTEAQLGKEE